MSEGAKNEQIEFRPMSLANGKISIAEDYISFRDPSCTVSNLKFADKIEIFLMEVETICWISTCIFPNKNSSKSYHLEKST